MQLITILKAAVRKLLNHVPIVHVDRLSIHSAIMSLVKDPTPLKAKFLVFLTPKGLESSVHACVACEDYKEAAELAIRDRLTSGLPLKQHLDCHVIGNFKRGRAATWATFVLEFLESRSGKSAPGLRFRLRRSDWVQGKIDAEPHQ